MENNALITNDAVVLSLLITTLALVFYTSQSSRPFWVKFYKVVPSLLLCYFIPSLYNSFGIIDGEKSELYPMASRYLLPVSLVLLTISIDFKALIKLGPKALICFLAGSLGIVIGGPIAMAIFKAISPSVVGGEGPDAVWRGLSTIAGSWIGGSANQTAMKEVFKVSDSLFSAMITMDVIVANLWMAFLLYGASISQRIDKWLKADTAAIDALKTQMEELNKKKVRIPTTTDLILILGVGFGITGISHVLADTIAPAIQTHAPYLAKFSLTSGFFWLIVLATTGGLIASFTPARKLENVGATKVGSVLLYLLIATIGLKMDVLAIAENPLLMLVGVVWMMVHVIIMLVVAKLIKAPFFFVAVGSQANVGGAASAPIVASAFSPVLAPVGVLLAVLGYALGTYGGYISGMIMQWIASW